MYKLVRPLFFLLNSETAHKLFLNLGIFLTKVHLSGLVGLFYKFADQRLVTNVFGLNFQNPVGLAAGFDKNGELSEFLPALSFGFTEIGTVTPLPQPGNPKPRLFRLIKDRALINRMGFNNEGTQEIANRLKLQNNTIPVGVNIGKNKTTPIEQAASDYEKAFNAVADSANFIVVNVSSPNTPDLRTLQDKKPLTEILTRLQKLNDARNQPIPLLLKIAPDLSDSQLDDIVAIARQTKLAAIIAGNTTVAHVGEDGGLSGAPIYKRALQVISYLYKKSDGQIPLIGCGGVSSAMDAYVMIKAGASLIQVYTGMIYEGPGLIKKINQGLVALLKRDGYTNIKEIIGKNS